MKQVVLALDLQSSLNPPEVIVRTTNRLATKLPIVATLLTEGHDVELNPDIDWPAPKEDNCLAQTRYIFEHHGYGLPLKLLHTLKKNQVEEVFVVGAKTEAILLAAGFSLFDMGIKATMVAPLCLTGQYHQHTVTMKIWESSIGGVLETVTEMGVGIS